MRTFLLLSLAIFVVGAARADATQDVLSEIAKCADIVEAAARLKCFDAAAPHAKNALATPEPKAPGKRLLEWFGLARPSTSVSKPEDFGKLSPRSGPVEEVTEITATVLEFAKTQRNKAVFILDNGQVWRQLDADSTIVRDPTPDTKMKITIETGALGSYNLTIEGGKGLIKVSRLK